MGALIINKDSVFISYNNNDLIFVSRFVRELHRYHDAIWFDRYVISLTEDWDTELTSIRQQATHAIVILSEDYLNSAYCQDEYLALSERDIPIIAIIARDIPVTDFTAQLQVIDWIDFRNWSDEMAFTKTLKFVLERLPDSQQAPHHSERKFYLYWLIDELERTLLDIPTSRAINHPNINKTADSPVIRPRGYSFDSLIRQDVSYRLVKDGTPIDDLILWLQSERQMILSGQSGTGKSVIAMILTLWMAHLALEDSDVALPIWFDLARFNEATIEDYIEEHWPLAFHWQNWLEAHTAFFVFENWSDFCDIQPDAVEEMSQYIDRFAEHRFILITRDPSTIAFEIPIVTIDTMQNHQIQRFGRVFLSDEQTGNFKRLVAQHKERLAYHHIDFISIGIELLATNANLAIDHWFSAPVTSLIEARWYAYYAGVKPDFSLDYFIKTMRMLAWRIIQQAPNRLIAFEEAKETVFQEKVLHIAVELSILEFVNTHVRFSSQLMVWYLATEHLQQDGLYTQLSHPQFDRRGQRIPTKWDNVIFALMDTTTHSIQRQQLIDRIAEIDPYLAWICMQQHPDLYESYLQAIVAKLVELRSRNPISQQAMTTILDSIPYREDIALILINQIPLHDWGTQQSIWLEVLRMPVEVPEDFLTMVRDLDRDDNETTTNFLHQFSITHCALYLAHILNHKDPQIQSNAIWLTGELQHNSAKIGLYTLLDHASTTLRFEIIAAMSNIADDELMKKLVIWLGQNLEYSADIGVLLYKHKRYVSGRLLMLLHEQQQVDDQLRNAIIKYPEEEIALAVAYYISTVSDLNPLDEYPLEQEDIMNVQKLLQSGMEHLPKNSFNRLIDDFQRSVNFANIGNRKSTKEKQTVAYRAQTAIQAGNRKPETATSQPEQDDILAQLQDPDWFIRRHATEQLGAIDTDFALPLLLESAKDQESHVRIVALNLLAKFTNHDIALQTLISALHDPEYLVIDTVTDLLKDCDEFTEDMLLALFDTDEVQTLASVIEIAGYRKYENSVSYIEQYIEDTRKPWLSDKSLAEFATVALMEIGTPDAIKTVNKHSDQLVEEIPGDVPQVQTAKNKPSYTTVEKITLSLKALCSDNWELSQKSARFLRDLAKNLRGTQDMNIITPLYEALSHPNWHVRWTIVETLAWIQHIDSIPYIIPRLADENWIVQVAAIRALVELNAKNYTSNIAKLLNHSNNTVREAAVEALGALDDPDMIPQLEERFQCDDDFIRLASIKAICDILGTQHATPYLQQSLDDAYVHIRWYAVQQLIPHMGEDDIGLLQKLLDDHGKPAWEDKSIHDFAYDALKRINTVESKKIIKDHDGQGIL